MQFSTSWCMALSVTMFYPSSRIRPKAYLHQYISFNSNEKQMSGEKFNIQAFPTATYF